MHLKAKLTAINFSCKLIFLLAKNSNNVTLSLTLEANCIILEIPKLRTNTLAVIYFSNMYKLESFKVYLNGLLIVSYVILHALLENIKGSQGQHYSEVYQQ